MVVKNYYAILGVSPESSDEEIKNRFNELSLTAHPDKGGNEEEYKKIIETYEVLGNPHQRLKYDLGLLREHYQYIEPEGKKTIYNPDEKIKDDLVWKIIETLEWELKKVNDLEQEELSKYGGNKLTTRFKDSSGNIIGPNEFCLSWIRYKDIDRVIDRVREYLKLIRDATNDKKEVIESLEEIGALPQLSGSPSLLKEELDNLEGGDEYDSCYRKLEEEVLRVSSSGERKEKILSLISDKESILFGIIQEVKPLQEKAKQRREKKRKLLRELNKWLENGEKVLADEVENKQEEINEFINRFSGEYLDETIKFEGLEEKKETVILEWKGTYKADEGKTSFYFNPCMEYEKFEIIRGSKQLPTSDKYFLTFSTFFLDQELQKIKLNRQKLTFFSELIGVDCRVAEEEVKKIFQTVQPVKYGYCYKIEDYDYPSEVISRNIQKEIDNKTKIEDLITRLNNWTEDETPETHEENTEIFVDPSAISEEVKIQFTTYLDNLLFNYFKKTGESKIPPVLNRIRNEIGEEFKNTEKKLKESKDRGEFENARYLIIRTVCEKVSNTGGSDEDLKERVKNVNKSFLQIIVNELKEESIEYSKLPSDDRFKFSRKEAIKTNYAKKIIEWELEILKKYANNYTTWQKTAIAEVKDYWNNTLTGLIRKGAEIKEAIGENWEAGFNAKTTEDEIKVEKGRLTGLIDAFKASEIQAQNAASVAYNNLAEKIKKETNSNVDYSSLINGLDWTRLTSPQTKNALINTWNDRKKDLAKQNDEIAYDNLLNQIKAENNQHADYIQLINDLEYFRLTYPRTKTALIEAWTKRKSQLAERAQREQERQEEQARQQAEKEQKEKEEKASEELENGNEEEKQQYQELRRKIENSEYVDPLEIENLRLDKWKSELCELLKSKLEEREQNYSEEQKLNKDLERLRDSAFLDSIFKLVSLDSLGRWQFLHKNKNPIDKWFDELEALLRKNDYQFLKEVCGEAPDDKREKLFQEIFSELKKEKEEIKSKKDFGKAKENQIRQYLQEIFKTVKEQLDENTEQEDKEKDDDIDSLVKEVEGFESNLKDLQGKIKKSLQKLAKKIADFPKNKKYLIDEKKVTNSIVELLKKVEKVEEAVNFSKKVISAYLEGKNLSEKETKNWLSKLEKENFANSQEVAQYFSKMINEINQKVRTDTSQIPKNRNIDSIYIIIGLISILVIGGLVLLKKRPNKKSKK